MVEKMAHCMKMTKAVIGHMAKHYERAKDENGEYIKFSNQSIDPERTSLNYNLAPDHEMSQGEFIKKRCSEIKCLNRKDVNVLCSWVVTVPKGLPQKIDHEQFFKSAYDFLEERYGEENVVSAYVHMDETTPHMHFAFVPVVIGKDGKEKLSAKERINRSELQRFHGDLENHMIDTLGYVIGIENGATKEGNIKIPQLKEQENHAQALAKQNEHLQNMIGDMNSEIRDLSNTKYMLERENADLLKVNKELKEELQDAKEKNLEVKELFRNYLESTGRKLDSYAADDEYNELEAKVEAIEQRPRKSLDELIDEAHEDKVKLDHAPQFMIKMNNGKYQAFKYDSKTKKVGEKVGEANSSKEKVKNMVKDAYGKDVKFYTYKSLQQGAL